ncbi:MAG: translation initiation factor IF-2 [Christensenellaceae bacterium]|jgi:translation initiation factor IF-2|nr:translation initiation factor IF-2 [Christensenellaceae bacterium]
MQTQVASNSGKLDNIKNIGALLPDINLCVKKCDSAKAQLEEKLNSLNLAASSITHARETEIRNAQKREEYADLIKQRQREREDAERKVDERAQTKLAAVPPVKKPEPVAKAPEFTPRVPVGGVPAWHKPEGHNAPRPTTHSQPWSSGRTFTPGSRPPYQGANPNYRGDRPYTPNPNYQGTRPQGNYPPRPPFDPNRPRPPYTPGGPRPQGAGSRPASARPLGGIKPTEKFVPKVDTFSAKKKVKSFDNSEKTAMDKRSLIRRGIIEEQEIEERMLTRVFRTKKSRDNGDVVKEKSNVIVINTNTLTVKTLSEKIGKPVTEIIKQLIVLGNMCTINSTIDFDTASLVSGEFGFELQLHASKTSEEKLGALNKADDGETGKLESRPAVVTVLGHVDHGKTSLLDTIRKTNVQKSEHGGITQHIGAYQVSVQTPNAKKGVLSKITFIDTPGHAAFEKMRARGASLTDIAILLVAGDDGVMPQTVEAIKHIQKHKLPMIVAVNKMDKKESNVDRVKEQLSTHNVLTEEWGGDAILVPISAATGMGIDKLLEMVLLVAEMNAYRANPARGAQGAIIDAKKDASVGGVVTVLVQNGTLKVGDTLLAGTCYGKIRKMTDDNGKVLKSAGPSTPVQVLGFSDVPKAGDACYVVDEKLTKQVVLERKDKEKLKLTKSGVKAATDIDAIASLDTKAKKQLNIIIKGDVSGSVEAIVQSVHGITSDEVNVNVISHGVGAVNDNDVTLAGVANALLIAFGVKTSPTATTLAKKQKTQIHTFNVIYQIFDFITEKMVRMFTPKFNEVYRGSAEVRALFKSSAIGVIAGCMVKDGKIVRGERAKLLRKDKPVGEYTIDSLKIVKDDAKEVAKGFECGIKIEGAEIMVGDIIQCFGSEQQPIIYGGKKYEF